MANSSLTPEIKRQIVSWCVKAALGLAAYAAVVFLAAGRVDWVWGWAFVGLTGSALAGHVLVLVPINPALLAEREGGLRQEGAKAWDVWVASLSGGVLPLISWVVAGLDMRFGWSGAMSLALHAAGLLGGVLGWGLFLWAMASNTFFSEAVRIQPERGHSVVQDGPYRWVRHPGYAGACLTFLCTPLLLGSWWALIPSAMGVAGYALRTALEDRTLHAELEGYAAYAQKVRYRLVPGLW
jgi:protein-S-isoprenylcysteine O-methyltransferase Ste14